MYTYFKNQMLHSAPATEENRHVCSFITSIEIVYMDKACAKYFQ